MSQPALRRLGWTLLLLAGMARALAADKPDCTRPYTLALHDHGLLYSQQTDSGIDKDIASEMQRRSGCRIDISLMPRSRIWKLIEAGALDFSLSGITNAEREQYAAFAWYFADKYALLVRRDTGVRRVEEFETLSDLKLGAIPSFRYSERGNQLVDALLAQNRVAYTTSFDSLYKNLAADRIQAMIIEPFDYPSFDAYQVRNITMLIDIDTVAVPHGLIMSKKALTPAEQDKWRSLINDMRNDGTMLRILAKYLPPKLAASMANF